MGTKRSLRRKRASSEVEWRVSRDDIKAVAPRPSSLEITSEASHTSEIAWYEISQEFPGGIMDEKLRGPSSGGIVVYRTVLVDDFTRNLDRNASVSQYTA